VAKAICPQAKTCGAYMVKGDGKDKKDSPSCPHMLEHEHSQLCNNGVCSATAPKSAKCVVIEVPVAVAVEPVTVAEPVTAVEPVAVVEPAAVAK
jgi:hypothetical protein